jgi:trigger factor
MYGASVKIDEVEKMMQKAIDEYIKSNEIKLILHPLSAFTAEDINWKGDDFTFKFDIGIQPSFEIDIQALNQLEKPSISLTEEDINKEIDRALQSGGQRQNLDTYNGEDDCSFFIKLEEVDAEGNAVENPKTGFRMFKKEDTPESVLNDLITGKEKDSTSIIDPKVYFSADELSSLLKIDNDAVEGLSDTFKFTLVSINQTKPAELNDEFVATLQIPEVTTVEQFRKVQEDDLTRYTESQSHNYLNTKIKQYLIENTEMEFPNAFIDKYYSENVDRKKVTSEEQYNEGLVGFKQDLKWMLISDKIILDNDIEISNDDIKSAAFETVYRLFMQSGYYNATFDMVSNYTNDWLKNENNKSDAIFTAKSKKVFESINEQINPREKLMTLSEFAELD